jgi:hypothetical protein
MSFNSKWRTLGAGVLGAALLVSTGCAETALVGQLDDSELQDPQVLPLAALGMSREINDMVFGRYIDLFAVGGHTDQITFAGVAGAEQRTAIGDVRGREESGFFEQIHEAVWAAYKIVDLAYSLQGDSPEFNTSPVVARAWLNAGFMERVMADNFCESIYQYGPGGGFNLAALEEWAADNGLVEGNEGDVLISKDSMYARAAYSF